MAKNKDRADAAENTGMRLAYDDLRTWLSEAERLGELKTVRGANWAEEIGMATELVSHSDKAPAVIFDDIPGAGKGFRVLANIFGGKRKNMTLGFPTELDRVSHAFENASLNATLSSSVGKPNVMFLRLPPKIFARTRKPFPAPGMSSKITAGALSEWLTSSVAIPISSAQLAPRTVFNSPSRSASESHVRRSS